MYDSLEAHRRERYGFFGLPIFRKMNRFHQDSRFLEFFDAVASDAEHPACKHRSILLRFLIQSFSDHGSNGIRIHTDIRRELLFYQLFQCLSTQFLDLLALEDGLMQFRRIWSEDAERKRGHVSWLEAIRTRFSVGTACGLRPSILTCCAFGAG